MRKKKGKTGLEAALGAFVDAGWETISTTWGGEAESPMPLDVVRMGASHILIQPVRVGYQEPGWGNDWLVTGDVVTVISKRMHERGDYPTERGDYPTKRITWYRVTVRREADDRVFVFEAKHDAPAYKLVAVGSRVEQQARGRVIIETHWTRNRRLKPGAHVAVVTTSTASATSTDILDSHETSRAMTHVVLLTHYEGRSKLLWPVDLRPITAMDLVRGGVDVEAPF